MITITIPRKLTKGEELVVIPRKQYEKFLGILERYGRLDQDLDEAVRQARKGETIGPFNSVKELKKSLEK
ncbi:hypothetical protein COS59_00030 [Candidatus Wolfebacteria bacterium CG03_land_8_20_14_0_80_36_15]|uniref:Uncharacterized protein n=1 Tax=Candidatus Wolfebacteria bacterium CG03_land_8_20_14_0_80_36_15 TaxID=1975067 RepID=A0A2M7B8D4_9BACT|nr:MAG: hypothetical protein COS59_00030 [Candidatus Wolfebacteria bacterium CG03_land_8_20_14_0_80_36_15]